MLSCRKVSVWSCPGEVYSDSDVIRLLVTFILLSKVLPVVQRFLSFNLIKFSSRRKWHSPFIKEEKEACPNGVFIAEQSHKH